MDDWADEAVNGVVDEWVSFEDDREALLRAAAYLRTQCIPMKRVQAIARLYGHPMDLYLKGEHIDDA